ncbi:MAG: acetyl-CoA carboxylase biotin carboxyl carrier protein subunit [Clostridiales bacterium]|nr:acetyl-CoA carboxylase biotin carboxyl carrier protein subunit [Clostridiales bacterium]
MSKYKITLNGKSYEIEVEALKEGEAKAADSSAKAPVSAAPSVKAAPAAPAAKASAAPVSGGAGSVSAPMPGTILRVNKAAGDAVKAGEAVVVLEAMKMENDISSPKDGVIKSIAVNKGDTVASGQFLFEVE